MSSVDLHYSSHKATTYIRPVARQETKGMGAKSRASQLAGGEIFARGVDAFKNIKAMVQVLLGQNFLSGISPQAWLHVTALRIAPSHTTNIHHIIAWSLMSHHYNVSDILP